MISTLTMYKTVLSALFLAILFLLSSVVVVGPYSAVRHLTTHLIGSDMTEELYTVVFDGGSTGTRIHLYKFYKNPATNDVSVVSEYFEQVKPGLSSYANDPPQAADSILPLLEKAKNIVPQGKWYSTQLFLKATAGLRQLPEHASSAILDSIEQLFDSFPFRMSDGVGIMEGEDEGLFGWFTVNFLLGHLSNNSSLANSVVVLDLGGGSTQITFAPTQLDTLAFTPKEYIVKKNIMEETVYLYSHSYLGLGLMSARLAMLQPDKQTELQEVFESPCIPTGTEARWMINNKEFHVSGMPNNKSVFQHCYKMAVRLFHTRNVHKPKEIQRRPVYAISYYCDRMVDVGFVGEKGGSVTVGDYKKQARKVCENPRPDMPFLCLDLTYIYALLHLGFGLSPTQEITLVNNIQGFETSWTLGAAFSILP